MQQAGPCHPCMVDARRPVPTIRFTPSSEWAGRLRQYPPAPNVYAGMDASMSLAAPPAMADEDRQALNAAAAAERQRLRAYIRRRIGDLAEAEDILQDVFTDFVAAYGLVAPIEQAAAWLLRVARNRIVDRYRARTREARVIERAAASAVDDESGEGEERWLDQWAAPAADGPEAAYERERLLRALEAAIAALPEAQRAVFVAHEIAGRSFKELAAASGENVNTLLGRKHAAVRALREHLRSAT